MQVSKYVYTNVHNMFYLKIFDVKVDRHLLIATHALTLNTTSLCFEVSVAVIAIVYKFINRCRVWVAYCYLAITRDFTTPRTACDDVTRSGITCLAKM